MPTYEYRCRVCAHELEAQQSIKDEPLVECPSCNALELERMISASSFQLRGGGWYKDLYSSPQNKPKKSSDQAA